MPTIPGHIIEYSPFYGYAVFTTGARVQRVTEWQASPITAYTVFSYGR